MLGATGRQRALSGAVLVIAVVVSLAAAFGMWRLAVVGAGLLIGGMAVGVLDLRRRSGDMAVQVGSVWARSVPMTSSIEATRRAVTESADRLEHEVQDRAQTLLRRITAVEDAVAQRPTTAQVVDSVEVRTRRLLREHLRETEALLQLYDRVAPREPMPPLGDWSLNPQGLLSLHALVQRHRPTLVLELGSGASTVWIGYALAAAGVAAGETVRLISIDHDEHFAAQTRAALRLHEHLIARTEVRTAPLVEVRVADEEFRWYDPRALADIRGVDLLIVDGPPGNTGPRARYPALPLLRDKLSEGALLVLDDADRDDEGDILGRWLAEIPGVVREENRTERQAVLSYSAPRK